MGGGGAILGGGGELDGFQQCIGTLGGGGGGGGEEGGVGWTVGEGGNDVSQRPNPRFLEARKARCWQSNFDSKLVL